MTIFIIVAVVIVVIVLLFFLLKSSKIIDSPISKVADSPNQYLAECVSEHIDEASKLIIQNNGYVSKDDYKKSIEYKYEKLPYMCYTEEFYTRCKTQEPVLMNHLTEETYNYMEDKIVECFNSLKSDFKSEGFDLLSEGEMSFDVELLPRKIRVNINKELKFSKSGETKEFNSFLASSVSPLYDMAQIVQRVNEEEALWINSEYLNIMHANSWVDINKLTLGDSNEIYEVIDTKTGLSWSFAVRGGVMYTPK